MPQKMIIDTDPGGDDAIAILLAAHSPDIELLALTTVRGNGPVETCTDNALRLVDSLGSRIPVYQGMGQALVRRDPRTPPLWKGRPLDLPAPHSTAQPEHAVSYLIRTLLSSDGDIILLPIGPLTNIAAAIRLEPRILPKIQQLVIMGGGHAVANMTPTSEYNIFCDPEAAKIVMNCGRPIRLVTLDATTRARVRAKDVARLSKLGGIAPLAAGLLASILTGRESSAIHDALALCSVLDPTVIKCEFLYVDVEVQGELTAGCTVCDVHHTTTNEPNVEVALDADEPKLVDMLARILGA